METGNRVIRRLGGATGLFVAALVLSGCGEEEATVSETIRPVRAVQLADSTSFVRRWFAGRARATQELDLSFRVAGPLIERPVSVGDVVAEGDLIARIDPTTFRSDVNRARAELQSAIAEAENAEAQLDRQQSLSEKGFASEADLDRMTAEAKIARASVAARRAVLNRAELDLGFTELRAPYSGEIVRAYVENFQDVRSKQPVARLVDSTRIEMVVDVPETLISYVYLVGEVEVIFDPFPEVTIPATIKEIGSEASETTRTYPVTVIMEQPDGVTILPGMAGKVAAKEDPAPELTGEGLIVPDTAVFTRDDNGKTYVWVLHVDTSTVHRREISTGSVTRFGHGVLDGVTAGDWVVTAGVHHLQEGQQVRLLEE